jgi:hypothetical protein
VKNEVGRIGSEDHPAYATLPRILGVQGMSSMVTLDLDEVNLLENDQSSENVYCDNPFEKSRRTTKS